MSRVIDADAFKRQVAAMAIKENYPTDKVTALLRLIDTQPTAINGIVTDAQYAYQRMTQICPVEHHYEDEGETPYIKYGCPICESLGNVHQLTPTESNCPICGVKLCWETKTADAVSGLHERIEHREDERI